MNCKMMSMICFNSIKYDLNEDMQTETEENIKFQFYQVRFKLDCGKENPCRKDVSILSSTI